MSSHKFFNSADSDEKCKCVKKSKEKKNKCKKQDPIVGLWTGQITFSGPNGPILVYSNAVFMVDGSIVAGDTAGLGQLSSLGPPSYIDSVFTGHWEKIGKKTYHTFFQWVENDLTGNQWPTTPSERRGCYETIKITSSGTLSGKINVYSYALTDASLSNPTPLISGTLTGQKVNPETTNPQLYPTL
jgi:hypothetical protein